MLIRTSAAYLSLAVLCLAASSRKPVGKDSCANASTQAEMNACWSNAAKSAEQQVSHVLAAAVGRIDRSQHTERIRLIEASQTKWEEYRDSVCAVTENLYDGGSIQTLQTAQCRLRLAGQRKAELDLLIRELAKRTAENTK